MASTPHRKTASIFVSEASIVLSSRNSVCSPVKSSSAIDIGSGQDFVDHYAILEVKADATSTEIREAFRALRKVYFQTDAIKYRALEAAFATLLDPEARQAYDSVYCARALGELAEQSKHGRKDSALSNNARIAAVLEEEDEQQQQQESELAKLREIEAARLRDIEAARQREMEAARQQEMEEARLAAELEEAKRQDPNWGLKHHTRLHEPLIGTQPYHSYIPILEAYEGREMHPVWKCSRVRYILQAAANSTPR